MIKIIKKNGKIEEFDGSKIVKAITKSANRVLIKLTKEEEDKVVDFVKNYLSNYDEITVFNLHLLVENALDSVNKQVATSYREYRNYKSDFIGMVDEVYQKSQTIRYMGDKENSNTDSALIPTKRSLIYNELNKRFYKKFFLTDKEREAIEDGFIYIHDMAARLDTYNCSLFDAGNIMSGGFEMGNLWYTEPNSIDTACDVLGDIIMTGAASQYGGLTIAEVDKVLAPYAEKSFNSYKEELLSYGLEEKFAIAKAEEKTKRDIEQGMQGLEMKLNSVSSSRGDFPFVTFSFGEDVTNKFSLWISSAILKVRREGQGAEGKKRCVLFPKLVFLYVDEYHGEGREYEWLFNESVSTSAKAMYPDTLSLSGDSTVAKIYKKYKKIVSPMGRNSYSPCKTSLKSVES